MAVLPAFETVYQPRALARVIEETIEGPDDDTCIVEEEEGVEVPASSLLETLSATLLESCLCAAPRSVSFGRMEIHEFPLTLGDHPSATSGPPVALARTASSTKVVPIDAYEESRVPRRTRRQMRYSYQDRLTYLQSCFSQAQMDAAWRESLLIRQQRKETLERGCFLQWWDDVNESMQRKYRRVLGCYAV